MFKRAGTKIGFADRELNWRMFDDLGEKNVLSCKYNIFIMRITLLKST